MRRRASLLLGSTLPLIASAALFLSGCERNAEEYQPEPNVYCVLRPGADTVRLLAGMTYDDYDTIPEPLKWQGVANVSAVIAGPTGEMQLAAIPDSVGYYRAFPAQFTAGDTYRLRVEYPEGQVVTGSTLVPDTFSLTRFGMDTVPPPWQPWPGLAIRLRFEWTASRSADAYTWTAYTTYIRGSDTTRQSQSAVGLGTLREDSLDISDIYEERKADTLDTLYLHSIRLKVQALDRNLGDYQMMLWWGPGADPDEMMHLDGGLGVFGSAVAAETTLTFPGYR